LVAQLLFNGNLLHFLGSQVFFAGTVALAWMRMSLAERHWRSRDAQPQ
jgi:hypothetical protein